MRDVRLRTGTLIKGRTASLSTCVAGFAMLLVGLVAVGIAAHQRLSGQRHDSQAIGLSLSLERSSVGRRGQKGEGGDGLEEHFDYSLCGTQIDVRCRAWAKGLNCCCAEKDGLVAGRRICTK